MHSDPLLQIIILLAASVLVVAGVRKLALPAILGYLAVGMLLGPHALALAVDNDTTRLLAEFGVVFLVFTLGLEFSLPRLVAMRWDVLGVGGAQVLVTTAVVAGRRDCRLRCRARGRRRGWRRGGNVLDGDHHFAAASLKEKPLAGKKGLVLGIANEHSLAYGCAEAFRAMGAELAITYRNDKTKTYVEPLAKELEAEIFLRCDVQEPGDLEAVFDTLRKNWGKLDFALHAIAFAPKEDLHGRLLANSSREGFLIAMDVSCHSFIRMAHLAEPLMQDGGALFTLSYYGAEKVVEHYNLMGPVKAALESSVRYLAYEFGPKGIRVHAISPGPVKTRAASGIDHFDELLEGAASRAPGEEPRGD